MKSIGFIGLGLMGSGFTKRLCHLGYRVVGYDIDPARIEQARARGLIGGGDRKPGKKPRKPALAMAARAR